MTVGCELASDSDEHSSSDFTLLTPQIQFDKGDNSATCKLSVINDTVYEGVEEFSLKLVSPVKVLLGGRREAHITLTDMEDGML